MIIWDRQTVLWWELALFPKEDMHLHLQQKCVLHTHTTHHTQTKIPHHTKQWHISHTHTRTITDQQQHKHVILLQYSHLFWLDICRTFYTWWNRKDPIAKPTNQFQRERGKNSGTTTAVEDTRSHVLVRHMRSSSNSEILGTGSRIDPSRSRVVVFGIVHHHCHLLSSGAGGQKKLDPQHQGFF